jgi:hypothetical protein
MMIEIEQSNGTGICGKTIERGTLYAFGACGMKKCCFVSALAIVVFLATAFAAEAVIVCVGPSATGDGSGANWNNIKAWSGTPARGDIWYLRDGSYGGKTFSVAASGTTVITIKKAIASDHVTETGWISSMANQATFTGLLTFSTSYWVLDGQTGSNWSKTTSDYGFAFSAMSGCIRVGSASANTSDFHFYHISATAVSSDTEKVFLSPTSTATSVNNVTLSHCLLNGWQCSFNCGSAGRTMNNWVFEYNACLNGFSSSANHGEDINNGYGYAVGRVVRYNLFKDRRSGTGVIITLNNSSSGDIIYGNVFKNITAGNGVIGIGSSGFSMTGAVVYNNTFISCSAPWLGFNTSGYNFSNCTARNNLLYSMNGSGVSSGWSVDYGAYYSCSGTAGDSHIQTGSGDPFVNGASDDYMLKANTTAGATLGAPYDADALGNPRTTWTRGAFEYGVASTNAIISVSPGTLNYGSVAVGTSSNLTVTVKNVGGGTLAGTATVSAPFSVVAGGTYSLGGNQSQTVTVRFSPTSAFGSTNSVTFTGGGGTTASVLGKGFTATPPLPPQNLHIVAGP